MGEVPILTVSAHVFQIDPDTKKKWMPLTQQPTNVSFYHDSSKNTYRIICIDDNKVLINCYVMSNVKFVKTSLKFGQWVDSHASTVYGLGFASENELAKFADKFEEIKNIMASKNSKTSSDSPPEDTKVKTKEASNGNIVNGTTNQFQKLTVNSGSSQGNMTGSTNQSSALKTTVVDSMCTNNQCSGVITLLRAENDRLKLELAQSSSKAREWEAELQTLRNSNVTLTTALEESKRNSEEWQKELDSYSVEITEAKKKLENVESIKVQLTEARERLNDAERMTIAKQDELIQVRQQYNESRKIEIQGQKLTSKLQEMESENSRLRIQIKDLTSQVEHNKFVKKPNPQKLRRLQEEISSKINELYAMNDQLAEELHAYL